MVALAIGAPLEYGEGVKLRRCESGEERADSPLVFEEETEPVVAFCRTCGAETGRWIRGSMAGTVP